MLNGGGWGTQVGIAAMLRERGYLLAEEQRPQRRKDPVARRAPRARVWAPRLVTAGLALLVRLVPRG
ncbi:MAG TPA: hypothetical protein VEB43_08060 [Anaeromyxobacter sp.]|nr:hypothetical protein [Anaeromyxobacter sp.]